jgi:hypothetical protein
MHLDLVDHLRCPNPHPDVTGGVALVCVPLRVEGRVLHEAMLGCAVCHARFSVHQGSGWFGAGDAPSAMPAPTPSDDEAELLRLAAMLNLDSPGGFVLLDASWATLAEPLAARFAVSVVVASDGPRTFDHPAVSVLAGLAASLPLAPLTLRGAAWGPGVTSAPLVATTRALNANGRLVAPVEVDPPPALSVLARDDRHWVAEPRAEPVSLRRAPAPTPPRTPGQ